MSKRKTTVAPLNKAVKNTPSALPSFITRFKNQPLWHLAILILLPFFLYIKTTGFQLINNMDDETIIINNFNILSNIKNIGIAFKTDAFLSAHGDYYRPLQTITLMIDTVMGESNPNNPWMYHLSNLIYHLLTVVSLYYFLRLLKFKNLTALLATLLFAVHPLLASAVSWVPARGDLLIGLFGLLSFITFLKEISTGKQLWFFLHAIAFFAALFSKETAIIIPVLLLLMYFFILKEKINLNKLLPYLMIWAIAIVLFYTIRSNVVTDTLPDSIFGVVPFINNLPAIPIVLAKFILPANLSTMPLFKPAFTVIGVVILLIVLWLAITQIKAANYLPAMGLAWFLLFIIPPMFFKILYSKFLVEYYEHRIYLPLIGLIIIVAFLLEKIKNHYLLIGISTMLTFIFIIMAWLHSDDYKESIAFFTKATNLNNPGACTKRGEIYYGQRDFNNALADFNTAIDLSGGGYAPPYYDRGLINAAQLNGHKAAFRDFSKAIEIDSTYTEAYIKRADERIFFKAFPDALQDLDKAEKTDSANPYIFYQRGKVYASLLKFNEALPCLSKSITMTDSSSPEMFNERAYVRYKLKDYTGALSDCNKAIQIFPKMTGAYYNKGLICLETGQPKTAIKEFDTTLALTNTFYFGYFYRGMAKKQINDMKSACEDWNESVKLGFTMAQDTIRRYCK